MNALEIHIEFKDNTGDIILVLEDDNIQDAIVEHCENEGYDVDDIAGYTVVEVSY